MKELKGFTTTNLRVSLMKIKGLIIINSISSFIISLLDNSYFNYCTKNYNPRQFATNQNLVRGTEYNLNINLDNVNSFVGEYSIKNCII